MSKIKKILIANRGEIAIRIIRTCKEMGIKTIALCPTKECQNNFLETQMADECCFLEKEGSSGYLDQQKIIDIAKKNKADAIHPGYGFLAENWKFAFLCHKNKIKFIGPHYNTLKKFEDKVEAKKIAKKLGISTLPASDNSIRTKKELIKWAKIIKPPFIIKAQRGGGGMGIRVIEGQMSTADLLTTTLDIQRQMSSGFSDVDFFLEKYLPNARHIEFQILGDGKNIVHLGERDCTIQRRFQKLVEETPSAFINQKQREEMGKCAIKIGKALKYEGAATVEFLMDSDKNFYFMEVNPRIQVEHTITEAVTHIDIVKEQIKIAEGQKLSFNQEDIINNGWAIEVRINAEDSQRNFTPTPGTIKKYVPCGGQGVFLHSFLHDGQEIYPFFDSMISKIVAYGKTRNEAIEKLKGALDEIIIEGVSTTIPFFKLVLRNKDFLNNNYYTNFIEKNGLLKELICLPLSDNKFIKNINQEMTEEEIAKLAYEMYLQIKKEKTKQISKWTMSQRLKMIE
ncbi:MAG: biotin carboxylase N-terminal domain-containing protein [Candidatus Pacebacteria bacterium]|nr:biotin carboxylase N-terminal domain-containing protein [Candidatus Paceibacterota bacterium]